MKTIRFIFAGGLISAVLLAAAAVQAQPGYYQPYDPYYGQPYDPYGPGYGRGGRGGRGGGQARAEPLYAVEAARDYVRIRVSSNGCTRRQDFQVRQGGGRAITFVRVRPDNCRAFAPGGVWLNFTYQELGIGRGGSFTVGNPLTPWIGPGN